MRLSYLVRSLVLISMLISSALANDFLEIIKSHGLNNISTNDTTYPALILLTTKNAPTKILLDFIADADQIHRTATNLKTLQLLTGIDNGLQNLFADIRKQAERDNASAQAIEQQLDIRFDPAWIKAIKAGGVAPVIALAECRGEAYAENCTLLARSVGDITLKKFLELSAEKQVPYSEAFLRVFEYEQE